MYYCNAKHIYRPKNHTTSNKVASFDDMCMWVVNSDFKPYNIKCTKTWYTNSHAPSHIVHRLPQDNKVTFAS